MAADRARAADDSQLATVEMTKHLTTTASGVGGLAERVEKDVERRLPERHGERHIAVVWHHIVAPDIDRPSAAELGGLVAGRGDHEMSLALAAEQPQPIVDGAGAQHTAQPVEHPLWRQLKRRVVERERRWASRADFFSHSRLSVILMGWFRIPHIISCL